MTERERNEGTNMTDLGCCTVNCKCEGSGSGCSYTLLKPFRVFYNTFQWWSTPICLLLLFILYIVLGVGFEITLNQTVYKLNENIQAQGVIWYFASGITSVYIWIYMHEWIRFTVAPYVSSKKKEDTYKPASDDDTLVTLDVRSDK